MTETARALFWESDDRRATVPRPSRRSVYLLLGFAVAVLGLNWPIMVTGLESFTPIWMAAFRVGGAAIAAGVVGAMTGNLTVPPRRDVPMIVSVAIFRLATVMVLVFFALQLVPAGRASVLVWTSALWTVPIAAAFLGEKMSVRRWIGLIMGISGVLLLSEVWGNDWGERDVIVGTVLLLAAAIVNASTAVHIRGHRWTVNPLQALPWQLATAAIPLVVIGFVVEGAPAIDWTPEVVWVLAYQAVLASGCAFWAQTVVLRNLSAISTNLTMMGVPVIGVVSSAAVLDERITGPLALGMGFVMAGVALNLVSER